MTTWLSKSPAISQRPRLTESLIEIVEKKGLGSVPQVTEVSIGRTGERVGAVSSDSFGTRAHTHMNTSITFIIAQSSSKYFDDRMMNTKWAILPASNDTVK
jgi:precorrin-3B methylase